MPFLFALINLLAMQEIPPLIPFSTNKYMSVFEINSNSFSVILNIASQLNPGLSKY